MPIITWRRINFQNNSKEDEILDIPLGKKYIEFVWASRLLQ
jgi:hypothetical protein